MASHPWGAGGGYTYKPWWRPVFRPIAGLGASMPQAFPKCRGYTDFPRQKWGASLPGGAQSFPKQSYGPDGVIGSGQFGTYRRPPAIFDHGFAMPGYMD